MAGLATYRHNFYRRQRGAALFIFIVIIIGGVLTGALLSDKLLNMFLIKKQQEQSVLQARESLINYMLLRAGQPLNIPHAKNQVILPRLLMLPCPDNLGDGFLDGSQDPTCDKVKSASDKVNGILKSGSRFGRLPWRAGFPTDATIGNDINDGLGRDFQDANGNRLWYAVSRKLVPTKNSAPLNFHHLAANDDDWLQMIAVNNIATVTVSKVAAVILSPGKYKGGRLPEDTIVTISMRYSDSQVDTDLYFEKIAGESNADENGVFVQAPPNEYFDDTVAYISFYELLREDGDFMRRFKRVAGIGKWQNAPLDKRPLARLRDAVNNWKNVFGFYPAPAANITVNLTTHFRHCAVADSGITAISLIVTSLALLPPADLQITASLAVGEMATLTISGGDFLITTPHVVGGTSLTIATWARVSAATVSIVAPMAVLQTISGGYQINAGVTVTVDGQIIIPRHTPINPGGLLSGWFPEHYKTTMTASRDGSTLVIKVPTKTGFLGKILLTSAASTITLAAEDSLIFSRGQHIKLEKDYEHLKPFDRAVIHYADGTIATLASGYKPVLSSYNKRHFVVLLHSDIARTSHTVSAPAVLYPWRTSPILIVERDNFHPWPPCFDSRDLPRELQTFVADNPIHYAVAENCHYGGEPSRCGQNGITLSIAQGAAIALPSAFTLTHSFTAHFDGVSVEINNGVAMASLALARPADLFIMNAAQTLAVMRLPFGFEFNHQTVVIPAGTKMTGGEGARIDNIPALLIYSPAPLSRVACLGNAASGVMSNTVTVTVDGKVAANQIGENLTYLCQWLDHDENADLDGQYELPRPQPHLLPPNDYFILLGGRAILE